MSKILIVDDHVQEIRMPLKRQLGRIFGEDAILEAGNGLEALEQVAAYQPAVIVLDIMMPVMNGLDACKIIRDDLHNVGVYIIMFTGREGGLPEGLEVGADVYLRKPCAMDDLIAVIRKGMNEYNKTIQMVHERNAAMARSGMLETEVEKLKGEPGVMIVNDLPGSGTGSWLDMLDK